MTTLPESNSPTTTTNVAWSYARLAVFVGVTGAVFVLGLCLWPTPVRGYVARAVIALRLQAPGSAISSVPSREQQDHVRHMLLGDEHLRQALETLGPPPDISRQSREAFPSSAEVQFVKQRLSAKDVTADQPADAQVALSYMGSDAQWSISLVDRLARRLIEELDERATRTGAPAAGGRRQAVAAAKREELQAQLALDEFLTKHFEALNSGLKRPNEPLSPRNEQPQTAGVPTPRINPKWQKLREEMAELAAQRERILLDRTPEHPQAQEAAVKLEALQAQLEQTPKFLLEDEKQPTAARRKTSQTVRPVQFAEPESDSSSRAGREYERLLAALQTARVSRVAAEREAAEAEKYGGVSAGAGTAVVRGKIVATARLAQTLREGPSTGRLTLLSLASIFVGACVASLLRLPKSMPVYTSLAQIQGDLSLPIVGVVSPASPSAALSR